MNNERNLLVQILFLILLFCVGLFSVSNAVDLCPDANLEKFVVHKIQRDTSRQNFGFAVAGVGDVNSDNVPDFAVLSTDSAFVLSGMKLQNTIHRLQITDLDYGVSGSSSGSVASVGLINGDAVPDFAVGVPALAIHTVYIYSGSDGSLIGSRSSNTTAPSAFGGTLAALGDVNGNGKNDFVVGDGRDQGFFVIAGENFATICSTFVFGFGGVVTGNNDFVGAVASHSEVGFAQVYKANACCISYSTNPPLRSWAAGTTQNKFLFSYINSGEGVVDVYPVPSVLPNNCPETDSADTAFFKEVHPIHGSVITDTGQQFGYSVAGLKNSTDNFVVGARYADSTGKHDAGKVYFFGNAKADTCPLYKKYGLNSNDYLGYSIAGLGDLNGDGKGDFIAGAPGSPPPTRVPGYVLLFVSCNTTKKGDMNANDSLTTADAIIHLQCVFLGSSPPNSCNICSSDLNCDGELTGADAVHELNFIFLGTQPPCPTI